ncbi:PAF acetylhydrolase family protein [Acephala macrosclerotiorum]|nr:PAF acetylhydrolase family protein [Acephala macrosclerotiorum]
MFKFIYQVASTLPGLLHISNALSFLPPNGPYNTSLTITALTDKYRLDPFAPTLQSRALMISIFTPVQPFSCNASFSSYMEITTAAFEDARLEAYGLPSGLFESLSLQTCQQQSLDLPDFPIILFSPAAWTTRLFYSAMAQQIASAGYITVTIDHPYDGDIVVFPDNTTVFGLNFTDDQIPLAVNTRAKDISFVLNQLARPDTMGRLNDDCDIDIIPKAGVFGHSLGGAASAEAMLFDSRFMGGVNLDGTFFGDVVEKGLDRPFLIFAHDGKNLTIDPSWEALWPRLTAWKRELMLAQSAHYTFSDLPDVVEILGFSGMLPTGAQEMLGSIYGSRAFEIVTTYVESFFEMVLKGRESRLFGGPAEEYPEVSFGGY